MKERSIICSDTDVRAILDGRKTQTRRVIRLPKSAEVDREKGTYSWAECGYSGQDVPLPKCPYGVPGDRLWVRETFQPLWTEPEKGTRITRDYVTGEGYYVSYPATDGIVEFDDYFKERSSSACKPSINMPRWASRITLEVTGVRVERVQEISADDAIAEGIERIPAIAADLCVDCDEISSYRIIWDSINAKRPGCSWDDNPWCWVVEFKKVEE